ncbi:MAG: NAD(P)/FAD-dependent oxidoreductase [Alphaproteobacteria bacterium]|nr:NAD(P)/FAD-dependent oxidoreductase [Alphaproteobacteria bacterium]
MNAQGGACGAAAAEVDVVIVGAGFSGMYMLHRLRGLGMSVVVFEAGADVGGTWYWNRYPGARCDIESMQYSFSFSDALQQEWRWSELYAAQPEILRYAGHVADRLDLRRDIRFSTRVTALRFDEAVGRWQVRTDRGATVSARFCIMATGCLSTARVPDFPGRERFAGETYHTGAWPHARVDFSGKRVGVIGTGSSAIQAIPEIAGEAAHLFVFQRTPNFSVPSRNQPMPPEHERGWKANYAERRRRAQQVRNAIFLHLNDKSALAATEEERHAEYEARWQAGGLPFMAAFNDLIFNKGSNDTAAAFVRSKIRALVRDPAVAERLTPKDYPIGTKRLCVDNGYFETFNRPNVTLVDLRETPLETITSDGLRTSAAHYRLDSIVFATGFDAMTGTLLGIDITGRDGRTLRDAWADGPCTFLGLTIAGFPNLFTITGPGSPSVISNMMVSIEQHVDWITDCLAHLRARGVTTIEPTSPAQDAWTAHVAEAGAKTLYPLANSWYTGANIPGKPRVVLPYLGGFPLYRQQCDAVAAGGYAEFRMQTSHEAAAARL